MELPTHVIAARLRAELQARRLQGYQINGLETHLDSAQCDRSMLLDLHSALKTLPHVPTWPYDEPSTLDAIRDARPPIPTMPAFYLAEAEIANKIVGGWLGRTAGCILGKPFEMGYSMDQIRAYLEGANAYPLADWVPAQSRTGQVLRRDCIPSMLGYVEYAQEDDDLNYMCLAVKLLERRGFTFTTLDVGLNWLGSIPFLWTWGPEHVVYLNLATAVGEHEPGEIDLEEITNYLNPGVEYIGAQIRTDVYGYVCPGLPELAAELAWRDAYLTHRRSGTYGAMWIAAMNAAAFTLTDICLVIEAGLAQVPASSRFAEAIRQTMAWAEEDDDYRITGRRIAAAYDDYTFAGAINNACCVAAALLYGWGDGNDTPATIYERTITTAVQLAYDTDCNGASAGSVVGVMLGGSLLPEKWTAPLHDTIRTCVAEFGQVSIRDMARRTYELSRLARAR